MNLRVDQLSYEFGEIVYHICGESEQRGVITAIIWKPDGYVYQVTWGPGLIDYHFEMELTKEPPCEWSKEVCK